MWWSIMCTIATKYVLLKIEFFLLSVKHDELGYNMLGKNLLFSVHIMQISRR